MFYTARIGVVQRVFILPTRCRENNGKGTNKLYRRSEENGEEEKQYESLTVKIAVKIL